MIFCNKKFNVSTIVSMYIHFYTHFIVKKIEGKNHGDQTGVHAIKYVEVRTP